MSLLVNAYFNVIRKQLDCEEEFNLNNAYTVSIRQYNAFPVLDTFNDEI